MAVLGRAFVMLVVLVGLPAAWVYYGPLPPGTQRMVDQVVDAAKRAVGWERVLHPAEEAISAPHFVLESDAIAIASESAGGVELTTEEKVAPPQIEPLLERLRTLGVVEYTLEKWGSAGQLYRFQCKMPLAQSNQITQQFEAVAPDPLASVEQVVGEVSSWQMARLDRTKFH